MEWDPAAREEWHRSAVALERAIGASEAEIAASQIAASPPIAASPIAAPQIAEPELSMER